MIIPLLKILPVQDSLFVSRRWSISFAAELWTHRSRDGSRKLLFIAAHDYEGAWYFVGEQTVAIYQFSPTLWCSTLTGYIPTFIFTLKVKWGFRIIQVVDWLIRLLPISKFQPAEHLSRPTQPNDGLSSTEWKTAGFCCPQPQFDTNICICSLPISTRTYSLGRVCACVGAPCLD